MASTWLSQELVLQTLFFGFVGPTEFEKKTGGVDWPLGFSIVVEVLTMLRAFWLLCARLARPLLPTARPPALEEPSYCGLLELLRRDLGLE